MDDTKTRVAITVPKSFWYKVKLSALSAEMKLSEFVESKLMFAMQCDDSAKEMIGHIEGEPTEDELRVKMDEVRRRNGVKVEQKVQTSKGEVKVNRAFTNLMGQEIRPMPKAKWKGSK